MSGGSPTLKSVSTLAEWADVSDARAVFFLDGENADAEDGNGDDDVDDDVDADAEDGDEYDGDETSLSELDSTL